jgi:hypothetical protein
MAADPMRSVQCTFEPGTVARGCLRVHRPDCASVGRGSADEPCAQVVMPVSSHSLSAPPQSALARRIALSVSCNDPLCRFCTALHSRLGRPLVHTVQKVPSVKVPLHITQPS